MKKVSIILAIVFVLLFVFCGCKAQDESYIGITYVYDSSDDGHMGPFWITLYNDGRFAYSTSYFSSFIGYGTWERDENDIITITETYLNEDVKKNRFKLDIKYISWIEEGSSNFIRNLKDNAIFTFHEFVYDD